MISLIYATSLNACIGSNGGLPWGHITADMKWFREKTQDKVVVMGSTTWKTLPKKLPNRINVVVSRKEITGTGDKAPDMVVQGTPLEVFEQIQSKYPGKDIVIIGGQVVYMQFLEYVEQVHVTLVQGEYDGDVYFDCRSLLNKAYKLEYQAKIPGDHTHPDLLFETYSRPMQ